MNAKEQSESSACHGDFQACANNFMSGGQALAVKAIFVVARE
jgi:hypothetical protein